jgi:hypothetical protein
MFADDANIIAIANDISTLKQISEIKIANATEWFNDNAIK